MEPQGEDPGGPCRIDYDVRRPAQPALFQPWMQHRGWLVACYLPVVTEFMVLKDISNPLGLNYTWAHVNYRLSMERVAITTLPLEILLLVPQHLHDIEDFVNLSSTCRKFHDACSTTSPRVILRLAAASSRIFFRPDPHFLIAATVRQVSDWALLTSENTETLRHAMQEGVYSLLDLCVDKAQLSVDDIRRLHATRFSLTNPISDTIDRCAGVRWTETPDFWTGGVSNPNTTFLEPTRALFQMIIYGNCLLRVCPRIWSRNWDFLGSTTSLGWTTSSTVSLTKCVKVMRVCRFCLLDRTLSGTMHRSTMNWCWKKSSINSVWIAS